MIKNKLDFKLINIAIICLIVFLLLQSQNLWLGIILKVFKIILPILAGFVIAYSLYPILEKMRKKIPKFLAIFILFLSVVLLIGLVLIILVPLVSTQIVSLIDTVVIFIKNISINWNINFGSLQETLIKSLNQIITNIGNYVSSGAVKTINTSISVITSIVIAFATSIYFLIDMDKIRKSFKKYLIKKSIKIHNYISILDHELKNYVNGFIQIVVISFFEYTIAYYIIGHPNALSLGVLSAMGNFIPYFGGTVVQAIAVATSFVISPRLCIIMLITVLILSIIDTYIINPLVYGKSNKVHPIIIISAVFIGGSLFGFIGIVTALPLAIIMLATVKFFKGEKLLKKNKKLKS